MSISGISTSAVSAAQNAYSSASATMKQVGGSGDLTGLVGDNPAVRVNISAGVLKKALEIEKEMATELLKGAMSIKTG